METLYERWATDNTIYNVIIEKIVKLTFELLHRYIKTKWDFNIVYLDIKRDEELENYTTVGKNPPNKTVEQSICEDYLYQLWIHYSNVIRFNNSLTTIYQNSINIEEPGIMNIINSSDRIIRGGTLSLEETNENKINTIIAEYSKNFSSNQKKYLKYLHEYEKLGIIKTLDITTIIQLKKDLDKRQIDMTDLHKTESILSKKLGFTNDTHINIIVSGIISIAIIILSILVLVIRKHTLEIYEEV